MILTFLKYDLPSTPLSSFIIKRWTLIEVSPPYSKTPLFYFFFHKEKNSLNLIPSTHFPHTFVLSQSSTIFSTLRMEATTWKIVGL